jgi:proline-specific peptidase
MLHNYMLSLDGIAEMGREVIYYDQIGCGKSSIPESRPDFWSAELFEEELGVMREALGLEECHIIGQSWGGMLAMQYALSQPQGVKSMVGASSPASIPLWVEEANRLLEWMPADMKAAIEKGLAEENYESPEYLAASDEYYRRHVINIDPVPDYVIESLSNAGEVYHVMQGYNEFMVIGKLKNWDITGRLHEITIPTLLTSGVTDEATPWIVKKEFDLIPDCEWALLMGTHLVHVEKKDEYNRIVEDFLSRKEGRK